MSTLNKVFSRYTLNYNSSDMMIESVFNANGEDTLFSNTFYVANQEELDVFKNIAMFVKEKKETQKRKSITIDLEDFKVKFNNIEDEEKEEELRNALLVIRNALSEENEEIKKHKEKLIEYENDLTTLKDLEEDGMTFEDDIKELEEKIIEVKKVIEELINQE